MLVHRSRVSAEERIARRRASPPGDLDVERLGEVDKIGIDQFAGGKSATLTLQLVPPYVTVRPVIDDNRRDAQAVLRGGRKHLDSEEKPAVPRDGYHGQVGACGFDYANVRKVTQPFCYRQTFHHTSWYVSSMHGTRKLH